MQFAAASVDWCGPTDAGGMTNGRGSWSDSGSGGRPTERPPEEVERFRLLYEENYRRLVGYALRRTSNYEEAADVVAESFLIAWRNLERVPSDDSARLWLYATARRVLANQRRSQQRRDRLAARIAFEIPVVPRQPVESDLATVGRALANLNEEDRNLLGLIGWEGLRPAEIAQMLGCTVGAVRLRTFRARRRLSAELELLGYRDDDAADPRHEPPEEA